MNSNSTKCKELIMYKKRHTAEAYNSILGIPQTSTVTILPGGGGGGGYSHTLPIRVCAAQRGRDFEAPDLERGIHFRGVF